MAVAASPALGSRTVEYPKLKLLIGGEWIERDGAPVVNPADETIEKANALPYGLAAYAFTNAARNVEQLSQGVEVGNLSINHFVASIAETPFGGVKDSGYGREGGLEGLQCYTVVKNVSHQTG